MKKFRILLLIVLAVAMLVSCASTPPADDSDTKTDEPNKSVVSKKPEEDKKTSEPEKTDKPATPLKPEADTKTEEPTKEEEPAVLTAQQILQKMQDNLAKTPCTQMEMVMDMSMTLDAGASGSNTMKTLTTTTTTLSMNPVTSHSIAAIDMEIGGEKNQVTAESYIVQEDGKLITYSQTDSMWLRQDTDLSPAELTASSVQADVGNVAIDEAVTKWREKDTICLTTTLTGDSLQSTVDSMLSTMQQPGTPLDFSALSCKAIIYLDPTTYLPMAQELDLSGMGEMMNPMYSEMGVTLKDVTCTASANFLSYAPQNVPALPAEAKQSAELWTRLMIDGNPDNGDGTFTLGNTMFLMDIKMPEGFTLDEGYSNEVSFIREDYRMIRYTLHYGTPEDITGTIESQYSFYQGMAGSVTRDQMLLQGAHLAFHCDIMSLQWPSYEEGILFAYADLGSDGTANYYLFVTVSDGYNDGMGNSKNADITSDEFMTYLDSATINPLMQ